MTDIFKVWTVHRKNDEYRNGPVTDVCSSEELANCKAYRAGWYGGSAPIEEHWAVRIDDSVYLLQSGYPIDLDGSLKQEQKSQKRKKAALAKLTDADKIALGLSNATD